MVIIDIYSTEKSKFCIITQSKNINARAL